MKKQTVRSLDINTDQTINDESPLRLNDLLLRIEKANQYANEILRSSWKVTSRLFGDSAEDAGNETELCDPDGMLDALNTEINFLMEKLDGLNNEVVRLREL
jgi:hypothetical protein